jgi:glutamyl-tRNA synthetase
VQRERCKTLVEMAAASAFFYKGFDGYDDKAVKKHIKAESSTALEALLQTFSEVEEWQGDRLHALLQTTAERLGLGLGKVAQPLRIAVTGTAVSPSIDLTLALLGKEKTLQRIARALEFIKTLKLD